MLFLNSWEKLQGKDISLVEMLLKNKFGTKEIFRFLEEINFIDARIRLLMKLKKTDPERSVRGLSRKSYEGSK